MLESKSNSCTLIKFDVVINQRICTKNPLMKVYVQNQNKVVK